MKDSLGVNLFMVYVMFNVAYASLYFSFILKQPYYGSATDAANNIMMLKMKLLWV